MATTSIRRVAELDERIVLAPERYHALRQLGAAGEPGAPLAQVVKEVRDIISPGSKRCPGDRNIVVFDTSDAQEGFLRVKAHGVDAGSIKSARKVFCPGDIIISRLRPYLRQIAYVDSWFGNLDGCVTACSSEFYVLRTRNPGESIAFLVPFLLSPRVQRILAAGQEGGHHPRFRADSLMRLIVPDGLMEQRESVSRTVERLIRAFTEAYAGMDSLAEEI
jgi:hypothetical protein